MERKERAVFLAAFKAPGRLKAGPRISCIAGIGSCF
jgi:hypothetical protein